MRAGRTGSNRVAIGMMVAVAMPLGCGVAAARSHHRHHRHAAVHFAAASRPWHRAFARRGIIQCVAFVKEETGVQLEGNAASWWDEAAGIYDEGATPEVGAILSFRGTGRIRLGHVAIVSRIVNARQIEVDQAHWASNGIARGVSVIDVSPENDWTEVRVKLNGGVRYGSVYATNGFIYDRARGAHVQLVTARERVPASVSDGAANVSGQSGDRFTIDMSDLGLADGADELRPARHWRGRHHHRWHRTVTRRRARGEVARQPGRELKLSLSYLPLFKATW